MKTNKLLSILFILVSLCSFAQDAEENDKLLMESLESNRQEQNELLKDIEIRIKLIKDLDKPAKTRLLTEIDSLQIVFLDNRLLHFELRTQLSSGNEYGLERIESTVDQDLVDLKNEIVLLESLEGLSENDQNLITSKREELREIEIVLKNDLIRRYDILEKKKTSTLLPLGDISVLNDKDQLSLNNNRQNILSKYIFQKQSVEGKALFANTKVEYKAHIWNTNFTIPIVRFNVVNDSIGTDREGDVALFNSIGAGLSYSMGRITEIRDANGEIIDTKFENTFGASLGVLFSASSTEGANRNVFAPAFSLNVLDIQFGYGIELGTRSPGQERGFFTVAYAIPLYKLFKGNYRVARKSKPIVDVLKF